MAIIDVDQRGEGYVGDHFRDASVLLSPHSTTSALFQTLTALHISLPLKGYVAVEVSRDGRETKREFQHIQADVEAYQAEEVGVEHLLRDVNDPTVSSLAGRIKHKLLALASLRDRLAKMAAYLAKVSSGSMEPNHEINALIQRATNLIANRECAVLCCAKQ